MLISFTVTAKLICIFVFAYAKRWFSHDVAHLCFVLQEGDTTSQARLSFNDPENSGLAGNTNFGNPLYKMNDDDL